MKKKLKFDTIMMMLILLIVKKAVSFLKTFLIATKFEKRNCFINLTVVVFHSSFNYGELVCNKSYNFATRFDITKM